MADPTELVLTAAEADALGGTTDLRTGIAYIVESTEYFDLDTNNNAIERRIIEAVNNLRLVKNAANPSLTYGIFSGSFSFGSQVVTYAGGTGTLANDDTNYIYLTPAGVLVDNVIGFPPSPHFRIAIVATGTAATPESANGYNFGDIVDARSPGMWSTVGTQPSGVRMREDFLAAAGATLPTPWNNDTLNNATADYVDDVAAGQYRLALTNANEAQASQLTWGDQLMLDTDKNMIVSFFAQIDGVADMTSVERVAFGLMQAHAAAETSLDNKDHSVFFIVKGAADANIYMQSDDGSTDTPDTDTGIDIVDDTLTEFTLDLSDLAAVVMAVNGVRIATTLDMTDSGGQVLQPIAVIQRDDASQTEAAVQVEIDFIDISVDR